MSHSCDVIIGTMASQITSFKIDYPTVYSDADQRKNQSSASLAFVRGIHRGPVNSPHKWSVTRKMFPFDDVIVSMHLNVWDVDLIYDFYSFCGENTCFTTDVFISSITIASVLVPPINTCGTIHARTTCTFINIWKTEVEQFVFHSCIGCYLRTELKTCLSLL